MKKLWVMFLLLTATLSLSACSTSLVYGKKLSTFTDNTYYLDLYLDEVDNTLSVNGSIVYINDQMDLDEIYLTIFPNADNTTDEGYNVTFNKLTIANTDYTVEFSGSDNTSIYLELEKTIKQGKNFLIEFEYEFNYWNHGRIFGDGTYFNTMFFYPFVSMYDEYGWNIEPYTFMGESYYNDIGDYYVSLNVRDDFKVACSGGLVNEEVIEDRKHLKYSLENARDFSFSASTFYTDYSYDIQTDELDIRVDIYAIYELSDEELSNVKDYVSKSFETYTDYIGPYDYNHFTLELGFIHGMESTGIAYCSRVISEETIVHEIIHQWIYSKIGNDQSDFSFIDEALTTFVTGIYFYETYGEVAAESYYLRRSSDQMRFYPHWQVEENTSMIRKVYEYGEYYGFIIYYHGPTLYKYFLDNSLDGDYEEFKLFLQALYREYKDEVVTLSELLNVLEDTTGVDGTVVWFMDNINSMTKIVN